MQLSRFFAASAVALVLCVPGPGHADDVLDAIDAARAAYEAGNTQDAIDQLGHAQQLVHGIRAVALAGFLPEPPEGWTREVRTDPGAALGLLGGGVRAEASYSIAGSSFTVTMMADNPMVEAFAGLLRDIAQVSGVRHVPIGSETFLDQDGELTALVGTRILVQASGAPIEAMRPLLETIDFAAMKTFGS